MDSKEQTNPAETQREAQQSGLPAENSRTETIQGNLVMENKTDPAGNLTVLPGRRETEETKAMKSGFSFFGPFTAVYALFYAFCLYKNSSGITFPFFVAGSLFYFCFSMKKLGLTLKKGSVFYMISAMLLAVSTFCTDDERIIFFNMTGIFLLMTSFLLYQFFRTEKWGLGKYLCSIVEVIITSIGELPRPLQDGVQYSIKYQSKEKRKIFYVFLGLVITVPLFLIVSALLGSADAVFRQVTQKIVDAVNFENFFGVIFHIVFWYFAVYMLMANLCDRTLKEDVKDLRKGEPILAITITTVLSLLYLFFSWIQIVYLFMGKMKLPEGYTYATYAREGFFQLLAVSVLNLVIVLICLAFFRESKVLRAVLTVMSLCTFVMIASSALRMVLYIQTYYLTFLRIFVLWALAVLTFLFAGVLISIYREKFPLFKYGVVVVTCFYLLLSFSHPDLIVAKVNLESSSGKLDFSYLSQLSADAAPVLIPYLRAQGYDLSVIEIQDEPRKFADTMVYGREIMEDKYWPAVDKIWGDSRKTRAQQDGFGYYYLDGIRADYKNMGLRNFNLSRFIAVMEAKK